MQAARLSQDPAGEGNRGSSAGGQPPLRKIRLHPVHLLGEERPLRFRLRGRGARAGAGAHPEQGLCEENIGDRDRDADCI